MEDPGLECLGTKGRCEGQGQESGIVSVGVVLLSSECGSTLWAVVFRCAQQRAGCPSEEAGLAGLAKGWAWSGLRTYGLDESLGQGGGRSSLGRLASHSVLQAGRPRAK